MSRNLVEGVDFYYDDGGLMVLTEKYHLEKGYCCGMGCRHCPYGYESVPEPQRGELLARRRKTAGAEGTDRHGSND